MHEPAAWFLSVPSSVGSEGGPLRAAGLRPSAQVGSRPIDGAVHTATGACVARRDERLMTVQSGKEAMNRRAGGRRFHSTSTRRSAPQASLPVKPGGLKLVNSGFAPGIPWRRGAWRTLARSWAYEGSAGRVGRLFSSAGGARRRCVAEDSSHYPVQI